jgi:FHS family L-fucose permease-like MFS transporter
MLKNIDAFGISGLVMMLSGLVCTDTEIAKFFFISGSYQSCGHRYLI